MREVSPETIQDAIRKVPLFALLDEADLASVVALAKTVVFSPGSVLIKQGSPPTAAYVVLEGTVGVWRDGFKVTTRSHGDCIGELSLLDPALTAATVMSEGAVLALKLDDAGMRPLLERPTFARALLRSLACKVREAAERHVGLSRAHEAVSQAFERYVSEDVLVEVLQNPGGEELLAGRLATATILFSDIRSFSTLSETLSPTDLVALLKGYLSRMIDVVQRYKGYINEIIGDALLVLYGLPVARENVEIAAVRTAIDMQMAVDDLNRARVRLGKAPLQIGVGVHTGEVVGGNVGDHRKMKYAVVGDTVNLASRLESLTKQYGVSILISEDTRSKLDEQFVVRQLDVVRVKGRVQPCKIYEVCGFESSLSTMQRQINGVYESAFRAYSERNWRRVRDLIESESACLGDLPSQRLLNVCIQMEAHPPGDDWDGTYQMTSK